MSDESYNPIDHINWDLVDKDHTVEWVFHLCELFNSEEEGKWSVWPEDFLWCSHQTSIPEENKAMWLVVASLIVQNPNITVSGNEISVTGRYGSQFKFEINSNYTNWSVIDALLPNAEEHHEFIPGNIPLCMDIPDDTPFPVGLYSLILALLDETKAWEHLNDWVFVECWICREIRPKHRTDFQRLGWVFDGQNMSVVPHYSRVMASLNSRPHRPGRYECCFWCGPNAPDHH